MRETKFRAWIKQHQEMIVVEKIHFDGYDGFEISSGDYEALDHLEVGLMQFTGLKDKNGKKIYENDIIKMYSGQITEIAWGDCGWKYLNEQKEPRPLVPAIASRAVIIGNIYEHEHLLNSDLLK